MSSNVQSVAVWIARLTGFAFGALWSTVLLIAALCVAAIVGLLGTAFLFLSGASEHAIVPLFAVMAAAALAVNVIGWREMAVMEQRIPGECPDVLHPAACAASGAAFVWFILFVPGLGAGKAAIIAMAAALSAALGCLSGLRSNATRLL